MFVLLVRIYREFESILLEEQTPVFQFDARDADQSFLTSYLWENAFAGNTLAYDMQTERFSHMSEVRPYPKGRVCKISGWVGVS